MNILHISSNYPPEIGGPAASVPYLAGELKKRGCNTCVLTRDIKGYPSFGVLDGIPVHRSIGVPGNFYNPLIAFLKSFAMGLKARKIVEREKIEIIHSHDINVSAIAGIIGSQFKDVKKVTKLPGDLAWEFLSLRGWEVDSPETFFEKDDLWVNIFEEVQRFICDQYTAIIVTSKYMKECLIKYSGLEKSRVKVVTNAIVKHHHHPEKIRNLRNELLGRDKYIVVSACRMMPWKGIEYLLEAFKLLPNDTRLILIGDGPIKKKLKKEAQGLNVKFLDKMPHRDVQAFIQASDVYVLPSIYEPFGIALLDCLVTQTPVIASKVGGVPEIITDRKTGLLVKAGDSEEIATAIERLLSDKELTERIKKNQEKEYKKYLWGNVIDEYIDFYNEVLDK